MKKPKHDNLTTRLNAAIATWREGKKSEAIAACHNLQSEYPGDPSVAFMLGAYLWDSGRGEDSIDHLRRAVGKRPKAVLWSQILFHALWDSGRKEEAADCLRALLSLQTVDDLEKVLKDVERRLEESAS